MESADLRKLHHLSEFRRLYLPRDRSILVERQVSARPLVVFEIRLQDATQAWFMQDDDVVQALAANRADQALDIGILPRRLRSGEDFSDAEDFFAPLHIKHVYEDQSELTRVLGLAPGYSFLIAGDHLDVWYDAALLHES